MASGKGIPANSSVLMPRLICRDPRAALDFYLRTFEAVSLNERPGPDGSLVHALFTIGPAMVMVEAEWPTLPGRAPATDGNSSVVLFLYVEDVDQTADRAVANGARIVVPLQDQFWGDRVASIIDPAGHVWTIASRIEETTAEERTRRWSDTLEKGKANAGGD